MPKPKSKKTEIIASPEHDRRQRRKFTPEELAQLRRDGVEIIQGPEAHANGRFAWIMDPDGNKIELWQPMRTGEDAQP